MSVAGDVRKLLRAVERSGVNVQRTRNGHYKVYCPDGELVVVSSTPSDYHALSNAKNDLRKHGVFPPTKETVVKMKSTEETHASVIPQVGWQTKDWINYVADKLSATPNQPVSFIGNDALVIRRGSGIKEHLAAKYAAALSHPIKGKVPRTQCGLQVDNFGAVLRSGKGTYLWDPEAKWVDDATLIVEGKLLEKVAFYNRKTIKLIERVKEVTSVVAPVAPVAPVVIPQAGITAYTVVAKVGDRFVIQSDKETFLVVIEAHEEIK